MRVLVLYYHPPLQVRKTIEDHLFSFKNYVRDVDFHYCNVRWSIPSYLRLVRYDAIILHYTLLGMKWNQDYWHKRYFKVLSILRHMPGMKIAIPQDEYAHTEDICRLFKHIGVETVFTCAYPEDYQTLYPKEKSGLKYYFTTFTGFVDEDGLKEIQKLSEENIPRQIDIGYRARSIPFWLGAHGQIKKGIGDKFKEYIPKTDLKFDISNEEKDFVFGLDWYRFLLSCRAVIGCLGGASLHDPDGSIRKNVDAFIEKNPKSSFEEVRDLFFKDKDYNLKLFAISPRHFECAMTKTCQVLYEGDYDVLKPGEHYIEVKKDYRNIEEVLQKVKDKEYCSKLAENSYRDIVLSGKYTYKKFAERVIDHVKINKVTAKSTNKYIFKLVGYLLERRKRSEPIRWPLFFAHHRLYNIPNKFKKWRKKIMSFAGQRT